VTEETLIRVLPALLAAAAAWGAVKQGLNGTEETIRNLGKILDRVGQKVDIHAEKIAAIERTY
jgi:hypothetical protein